MGARWMDQNGITLPAIGTRVDYRTWGRGEWLTGTIARYWEGVSGGMYVDIKRDGYHETAVWSVDRLRDYDEWIRDARKPKAARRITVTVNAGGIKASNECASVDAAHNMLTKWMQAWGHSHDAVRADGNGRVYDNTTGVARVIGTWSIDTDGAL